MKNFTISLYAFHLRHSLTDSPDEVDANANLLWENLAQLGEKSLQFPKLKNLRQNLICYQDDEKYEPKLELGRQTDWLTNLRNPGSLKLGSISTAESFKIKGNLQPFLVNDTYAADLTLSPEPSSVSIDASQLQLFKSDCLLPSNIQASLGHTLWIYGEVDASEDCQALAYKYAEELAGKNLNPVLVNHDKLFGSHLFEYQATDPNEPHNLAKECQILVLLNNSKADTVALVGNAYDWLLNLLICRHKILYIYQEACKYYPNARELYSKLDKQMQEFQSLIADPKTRLEKLKELLTNTPLDAIRYERYFRDLKAYYTAISTNTTNYRTCLEKIKAIGNHPQFWEDFLNRSCQQWQNQIQIYSDYLAPGQELFEKMIDTIRGIVEIEQAESDRRKEADDKIRDAKLQNTIQAVGVGIGVGTGVAGIFSQTFPLIIEKEWALPSKEHPFLYPHPFLTSFGVSLMLGAFLGWHAWRYFKQRLDNKLPLEASSTNTLATANSNSSILPPSQNSEFPSMTQKTEI
ncbi:hypothetical protein [Scytonema sp. UIC 10036]|uniref:hypothetical protein n=1 Tax=Scytonema sp. UIC 10036 TaxID=2304196 RepID=UPI001A9ADA60|nr:hypothetical protein [Scytonema sp. UIC 10036]